MPEGKKVKDLYTMEATYLVDWFGKSQISQGFNGYIRKPIEDYPMFDRWISQAFDFMYKELTSLTSQK